MADTKRLGSYVTSALGQARFKAFIPPPLPPQPALDFSKFQKQLDIANVALGRLDEAIKHLPSLDHILYSFVRKEALLSSQIEGTQSSFSDLLLFELDEAPGVPVDDVEEVSNYVAAIQYGLRRMAGGFPISLRLIREMHKILLKGARGHDKAPGEFRKSQNWVGGPSPELAQFVPPPVDHVMPCLDAFEKFLHDETIDLPLLVKAGLVHVQFETIHPFLDGNGRLGRLLITLMLCAAGVLKQPAMYLSLYLKANRLDYYDRLSRVRTEGDWEGWLAFFLYGIGEVSTQTTETAGRIVQLFATNADRINQIGRARLSATVLHELMQKSPLITLPKAAEAMGVSLPTAIKSMENLTELGITEEVTGQRRNRVFVYKAYLDMLSEGTEPIRQKKL
jgi:Fic family protein